LKEGAAGGGARQTDAATGLRQGSCTGPAGMTQVTGGTLEDSAGHTPDISNEDGDDERVGLHDKLDPTRATRHVG